MNSEFRVVCYLNQFFGQIGGEDKAGTATIFEDKPVGPALAFQQLIKDEGKVVGTIICGDNYLSENTKQALDTIMGKVKELSPDIVVVGPAFNAGRYGLACAEIGKAVSETMNIPVISGMYPENPGVELGRKYMYIVKTSDSAAGMKMALSQMAYLAKKLAAGMPLDLPEKDGYIPQGRRVTVFAEKRGSLRAVEMLLKRLKGEEYQTELPMPEFNRIEPAPPIKDLSEAVIALVCSGGIVPKGNPDRIESASATKYGKYPLESLFDLRKGDYETIHGGYDPVYANEDPDRVLPLDAMRELEAQGKIGRLYDYFYSTVGTGTSVANAEKFGREIGEQLKAAGVEGVILTST